MKKGPVTVAIVDDHALIRETVHFRLTRLGYKVIMEAENGKDFLDKLESITAPDICLLDINMPVMNGFETTANLKKNWPAIKILVFSMQNSDAYRNRAMQMGADGFIPKDAAFEELNKALLKTMSQQKIA